MDDQQTTEAVRAGLETAIEERQIVPWFQPVMDPAGVNMLSAEALPRWEHPIKGAIPAGVFIKVAIESGLLPAISRILLDASCECFATWRARGIAPATVSVNLTGAELRAPATVEQFRWAMERHDVTPDQIAVEIGEQVLHEGERTATLEALRALGALGIKVWLDDFGAGPCDMEAIGAVDFALAKVDRGIVGTLDTDPEMVARLEALVGKAQGAGMRIIAKGVETRAQIDTLVRLGCDGQQGFAIARPMAPDAFAEWLDLNTWAGEIAEAS